MELTWGEDFAALTDVSKSVFARYSPLDDRSNTVPFAEQVRQFAELGWLQLADPSGTGDESASLGTIAAIFVEMGRALAQTPLLDLTVARDAAILAGSPTATALAARIGDGDAVVVPAFGTENWGSAVSVTGGSATGRVLGVEYADQAESLLVHAVADGESLLLLVDSAEVSVEAMPNIGGHPTFSVTLTDVAMTDQRTLARGSAADHAIDLASQRGDVLRAAQVHGAGMRLLDMTVRYAQQRHQFGGAIGRFQAVQYLCTDIAVNAHVTSAHTRAAATAIDTTGDGRPYVDLMRNQAILTAREMVHCAHEVHAGIGYMVESNVHLFTDAAKRWQFDFGDAADLNSSIVSAITEIYEGV
ncbi:acyl-CoA/acyl-ACP dehydrogenase [Gordonia sp. HY285]|uniref:Acyl-CoA/acyl-ACP dehydrogenase n=1 Tax=Gordonia liuliyuniae TaxID=2911517 RepID=A0ABS9IU88_9ACTN|nr:acyl-CoA dehydrogenase family protein [Gordonia liuliyuniae]MCF8589129.1 acyl-CoA/acyl-ACP dehydrogenase [Gordonia liuliyuniae]MCF8608994.1 acyl-CoA/acyl-ACP dehydrogenase [Gordonia liuliyuniae]